MNKATVERNQRILLDLIIKPGNDVCADCKSKGPRWASHNLGVFLCVNCASIHRKIGTHVTKVKSVTMDSWTKEQVEVMKSIGNVASNAKYNPNESRHSPPANREDSERDSEMEKYIRSKYEFKRFMVKSSDSSANFTARGSPLPRPATTQPQVLSSSPQMPSGLSATSPPISQPSVTSVPANSVWNDLISLSETPAQSTASPPATRSTPASPLPAVRSSSGTMSFQSTPSSNFANNYASSSYIHTGHPPATLVQQGGIIGYDPNIFAQQIPTVGLSVGLSTIPHPSPYLQQTPLHRSQAPVHPMGTQSPAGGFSQPFPPQQGINPLNYALAPRILTPSLGLQQTFHPHPGQNVDNTFYTQWQPTQTEYSFVPEYNQWTA